MANARPLDDAALTRLREDLASGKRPSLVLLSGGAGLAAGSRGQLVRIDDPPQDTEFLHVRVGNDELPFAPEELGLPGRRPKSAPAPASAVVEAAPASASASAKAARAAEPILEPVRPDRRTRAERVVTPPPTPAEPAVAPADAATPDRPASSSASGPASGGDGSTAPRAKRSARTTGGPPKITLTLRFAEFGWTVEALVAGRREKPQPVPLAAIRAFADQLEDQGLRRQLDSTVEACRGEAQKRASSLRAELQRLETELAALDD
jgi:hypothetical protein